MPLHPTVRDERHHPAGPGRWWGETWAFDAFAADRSVAVFSRLTVYPRRSVAWFVAGVVRPGHPYVLCRDDSLAPPAQPLVPEVRGEGLWTHLVCETPFDHWTHAMEAYAVAFDDPRDACGHERGDRIGLAFDLEWEQQGPVNDGDAPGLRGYDLTCEVNGTLQVADATYELAATGRRSHHWGVLDARGWRSFATGTEGSSGGLAAPFLLTFDASDGRCAHMVLGEAGWSLGLP